MLNKELPFLRVCLPLSLGIISGNYLHPPAGGCILAIIITSALLSFTLLFNRRLTNPIFGLVFYSVLFFTGMLMFVQERERLSDLNDEPTILSCIVSDFPQEKNNTYLITLKLNASLTPGSDKKLYGSVIMYCRKDSVVETLIPGDSLIVKCRPQPITNRGNPYEFDYRFYMESQGVKYFAFASPGDLLSIRHPSKRSIIYRSLIIRNRIIDMFRERGMTGRRLALVSAITLGEKSHLDQDEKQYFINAGIMHIMAVSGLHAVILSYFIFSVLFFLRGKLSILRIIITLSVLWAFAFVTGLTPSVLRATIMFTFLQSGKLLKRPVNPVNSVLASAFILILIRPSVIFDAGFLLSYVAVLYIILFYHDLYLKLTFKRKAADTIWQSAAVTITAQAGTLPLTIMLFNRFPTWFILTNVIIVPVSSVLIVVGCLVPLTYPLVHVSEFLTMILDKLTWLTEFLTEKAASLPFSTIDNIGLTGIEGLLLTMAITLGLFFLLKKDRIPVIYPLVAFLLFSAALMIKYISTGKTSEVVVYNIYGGNAVGLRSGRTLNLYSDSSAVPKEVARHCAVEGLKVRNTLLTAEPVYANIEGHRIVIAEKYEYNNHVPEGTELAVFTSKKPFPFKQENLIFPGSCLVLTTQSTREISYRRSNTDTLGAHTESVRLSGAYSKRL